MFEYYDINLYDRNAKKIILNSVRMNIFIILGAILVYLFFILPLFLTSMLDDTYRISIFYFTVLLVGELAISCFFGWFMYISMITSKIEIDVLQNKTLFCKYFAFILIKKIKIDKVAFKKVIQTEDLTKYIDDDYNAAGAYATFGIKILSTINRIPDVILSSSQKDREKTKKTRDILAKILNLPTGFKRFSETARSNTEKMDHRFTYDDIEEKIIKKII